MSSIVAGDEHYHYCDGSHRWLAPAGMSEAAWRASVEAHQLEHRATMGGAPAPSQRQREQVEAKVLQFPVQANKRRRAAS